MVLLVGLRPIGSGVYWHLTRAKDPGVLTIALPEEAARNTDVPDVSPAEIGRDEWTIDFDAVREHLAPQTTANLPAWARGLVGATPSETGGQVRFELTPQMVG